MTEPRKPRGRPCRAGEPANNRLAVELTDAELTALQQDAANAQQTVSAYVRETLDMRRRAKSVG